MSEKQAEVKKVEELGDVPAGEIHQDESGNVVIGAPAATGAGEAPPPGGDE